MWATGSKTGSSDEDSGLYWSIPLGVIGGLLLTYGVYASWTHSKRSIDLNENLLKGKV